MEIGAQLYTVRDFCKTPEALSDTLKKIADIGYRTVQVSGTCTCDPLWLKEQLGQNGLRCVLTHTPADLLTQCLDATLYAHTVLDCRYIGLGWYPFNMKEDPDSYQHFCQVYTPVAKSIHSAGKYFMYHNHDQEFQHRKGKAILQCLMEDFPADWMGFTLDTFWIQAGGGDPAQWLELLHGRVPCIHLKDYAYGRSMAVLGEGNINFDRVLTKAEASGTSYLLVEQDDCHGEDPFVCLRRSYQYLTARGLH